MSEKRETNINFGKGNQIEGMSLEGDATVDKSRSDRTTNTTTMSGAKKSAIGALVTVGIAVGGFAVDHQTQALGILKALGIGQPAEVAPADEPQEPKVESTDAIE